ncbi:MAG TPA: hypothetical protein VGM88_32175 [Kofleriaceae bacterium]|jgi:hypothetical protein
MTTTGWRTTALVLAALSGVLLWRDCHRPAAAPHADAAPTPAACAKLDARSIAFARAGESPTSREAAPDEAAPGMRIYGVQVPAWAAWFAPQPGESIPAYRDRLLPVAEAAVAPQRARVAHGRDDFAALAALDDHQRAELDGAAREAADQIEEKLMGAAMNGDFSPATFKPMTGIALARDILDTIDKANQRWLASLSPAQREKLAANPFDFADYLAFSTHWEEMLKVLD